MRRAPDDAALISTNHHRGTDLDTAGRCRRYDYLHDASAKEFGHVSRDGVQAMLGEVAQGKMTLQSMVFEPANRVIYLAVGKNAPKQGYHKLELGSTSRRRSTAAPVPALLAGRVIREGALATEGSRESKAIRHPEIPQVV